MFFSTLATTVAIASALVEAYPAAESAQHGVTFHQEATGRHKLRSGPVAMAATYRKYGAPVPENIKKAAAAAVQQGSVSANPEAYDQEYLCPVDIGTPAQRVNLDFDTGSADLWAFCSSQPSSQRAGHDIYTPSSSSTSRQISGETWKISYGDGSGASGTVYADKVVIGGVTATSQAVECATSVSTQFQQDTNNDGLVGLAFSSINTGTPQRLTTFFDTVKSSLPAPIFAAYLRHGQAGSYDFGYIDSSKYTGSLTYVNVNTANGFWEFTASGFSVGSTQYSYSIDAIADTGTSLVYLPKTVLNYYYAKVSGAQNSASAGGYIFPCSSTLPSLSITIGGVSKTIPGSYLNYAPYSGSYCFGGLQDSAGIGFSILGDVFLKSQYVVHDVSTSPPRIGFATQR